ncbi:interferon-induced protein 44-like [Mercenaria mercenaria]|uniref:interferon-induced protein 44-like n=1 Tax=Mercenaria mercenaria TaxID=6596 RepID=UPI00234E3B2F|nr:interferon-induced protein 44-like [Mercenaria mercenaria]
MGNRCSSDKWRNPDFRLEWTSQFKTTLNKEIKNIPMHGINKPCIMLAGPVSAGKSSLVNTFLSAESTRLIRKADSGSDTRSVTTAFMRYDSVAVRGRFRLCDTMGILADKLTGLHPVDMSLLMKGHIRAGYKFQEDSHISEEDEHYIKNPSDLERSHCFAIVFPCTQVENISSDYKNKIVNAIRAARVQNIPTVIVLTKIDKLCTNVMKSVQKVFTCSHIRDIVKMAEEIFGVPEMYIFPVVNYSTQQINDVSTDIIALLTLKKILEFTSDHIEGPEQE